MRGRVSDGWVARALAVALAPWCLGCATEIYLRQAPAGAATAVGGRVQVRVFENGTDRGRDRVTEKEVLTELSRVGPGAEMVVRETKEARWSVAELPPGAYVLRAVRCVNEWGVVETKFQPKETRFTVREHESTFADVVLDDPRQAWIGVLAGIVLTYALVEDTRHGGDALEELFR